MEIKAKDLRTETKRVLETVARGEEVVITYRGTPRAKLVAVDSDRVSGRLDESPLFGMWRDHQAMEDVDAHIDLLRKSRY
jgi:prevent-host-death family protein